MKRITVTQIYELGVCFDVDVSDDFTYDDMINSFTDFPIRAEVNAVWEDTENVKVINTTIDWLDSLTGGDALILSEWNEDKGGVYRIEPTEEQEEAQ